MTAGLLNTLPVSIDCLLAAGLPPAVAGKYPAISVDCKSAAGLPPAVAGKYPAISVDCKSDLAISQA